MAYIPKIFSYGQLPDTSGNSTIYKLSDAGLPGPVKEVLVYMWATTKGDEAFHRYYYEVSTKDGTQKYSQYMNVAASRDVSLNSANLWLPVFPGNGEVTVKLVDADPAAKSGKCIAHRCQKKCGGSGEGEMTFSEFFVLGYRT